MANYQVNGSGTTAISTDNEGGTILRGGNITSNRWDTKALSQTTPITGSIMYNTSGLTGNRVRNGVALSGQRFASMAATKYVGIKLTNEIAGTATSVASTPASTYGNKRSIHKAESWRLSTLTSWSFSDVTDLPTFSGNYSHTNTGNMYGHNSTITNPTGIGVRTDAAAEPSRTYPGQLVFKGSKALPTLAVYSAKTS
jgi:hypothetical protein